MPTLCFLEVTQLRTKAVDGRRALFSKKIKLETKAMTTSSHCNTGRMCVRFPIITRENTPLAIHVVQKITVIHAQKIGKFAV